MSIKSDLAIVTMVYDDTDHLRIWLDYWRGQLPQEQLFVLVHGGDPELQAMAVGTNVVVVPRPEPYPEMEEDRWKMLSDFTSGLLERFRVAVYTDVDEILVADPAGGKTIAQRLAEVRAPISHSLGLEIIHRPDLEPARLDPERPVLEQRHYYRTTSFHSKPSIITQPVEWGRGGHFHKRRGIRFAPGVFCIHQRFSDTDNFLERTRRRRATTKAPKNLDAAPHRRWRSSDDAAQELIDGFQRYPIVSGAPFFHRLMKLTMKTIKMRRRWFSNAAGFYMYRLFFSERLHRFPERFRDLF